MTLGGAGHAPADGPGWDNTESSLIQQDLATENLRLRAELAQWRNCGFTTPTEARRYHHFSKLSTELTWSCEPAGRCNYVSPQWRAYTGAPSELPRQLPWSNIAHAGDKTRVTDEWAQRIALGVPFEIDYRARRVDGAYRWLRLRARPVHDPAENIVLWNVTETDIDDLRRAEAEVQRLSLNLEQHIAQGTPDARLSEWHLLATSGAKIGIWDWSVASGQLVWDPQMRAHFGLALDSQQSAVDVWSERVHPEDQTQVTLALSRAVAGGGQLDVKFRVQWPNGETRHLHSIASVRHDSTGNPERILGVTWDRTREVVAQEALRQSEERWQLALQGTGDGVWDWDLRNQRIYLSHRSRELLGYEGEELTNLGSRTDLVHPEDSERARVAMQAHLRGETPSFNCEYRMRRKDGSYIWILGRGRVIERDENGKPVRLVGTHKDIAERHLAEEALKNREALLREFITHTPAAIAMLDRNLCYIQASRRWLADYKLDDQDIVGRSHYDVFPDIPERWQQIHQRVLSGAVESCNEDPFPRENGEIEWLQWEARPWRTANGEVGGLIFFTQVITERKQLGLKLEEQNRQLSRSNAELEQFAYVASHDLQEPLRAIAGCTQILARRYAGKLDGDADELIEHIVEGASRMKDLIEGLLSLSRVSSQRHVAKQLDVGSILDAALKNLHASIVEQGAKITHGELPSVQGDATQVLQLFQNLIGNALKYRRDSSVPSVKIAGRRVDGNVEYAISDNGIGIEGEYFERIFGVFQRLHTRQEYPGTGIGLAICRKIVERHGGRIWVDSELGAGATFRFTLPG